MILIEKHPLLQISKEVKTICKPLKQYKISVFTYTKNFYDGSKITLSNEPQWVADYYNLNLFQSSYFEADPKKYRQEFNIWIGDYDIEVYWHGKHNFNSVHTITITQPQIDGCEFFFFSFPPEHEQYLHYLSNNMDILYHFILYFKDKAKNLLKKAKKYRIIINNLPTREEISPLIKINHFNIQMEKSREQFYKETHIYKYIFENGNLSGIKLSNREIDCIYCLLNGMTSDEIAKSLKISKRTVDSYIDNIKLKLKLTLGTRNEIIKELKQYKMLNAIRY
jgi:DNA-binding CsgD family transcriptional regulator